MRDSQNQYGNKYLTVTVKLKPKRYYYLKDHLGSVRAVVDDEGNVVSYDDYYPFGLRMPERSLAGDTYSREKYTGHEKDEETGWYHAGARYYDPVLGRWMNPDPLMDEYPGLSPYNFVLNNPVIFIDVTGLCPEHKVDDDGERIYCLDPDGPLVEADREDEPFEGVFCDDGGETGRPRLYVDASTEQGRNALYNHLRSMPPSVACNLAASAQFSELARGEAMRACMHGSSADIASAMINHPAMIAMTLPVGGSLRAGASAFKMYRSALQAYKGAGGLSNAGRALTKHPEVIGLTKQSLRQTMRLDSEINMAAHVALKTMMRSGVQSAHVLPRYGSVIQFQIPGGAGARFYADTGKFIGFITP